MVLQVSCQVFGENPVFVIHMIQKSVQTAADINPFESQAQK
jgi:hypothetical protein